VLPWDFSETDSIKDFAKEVCGRVGEIAGLVHCAGIFKLVPIPQVKEKQLLEIFRVNTFSAIALCSAFARKGRFSEGASFVLISSISAHEGVGGGSIYAASKAALEGFMTAGAPELADKGIRLNWIAPGTIRKPMIAEFDARLTPEQDAERRRAYPLGLGEPSDIANFIAYLLSDAARWITGQTFIIDGGHMIRK
jgi:NAD(P)-dependent dehydrogenase (short-subunit alcohol dehydrogenase family)